jgi:hypothetical protein
MKLPHTAQRDTIALVVHHKLQRGVFAQEPLKPNFQRWHVRIGIRLQAQAEHTRRHVQTPQRSVSGVAAQSVASARKLEAENSADITRMQLQEERGMTWWQEADY